MKIRRKGNRWEAEVYAGRDPLTGKERRVSRTTAPDATREEAEELWVLLRKEVRNGLHDTPGRAGTFAQLLEEWFAIASVSTGDDGDWSPGTAREHRRIIRSYLAGSDLGRKQVRRITALDLDRFYAALLAGGGRRAGQPLTKATVRRIHVVVVAALDQALSWGLVANNVARDVRILRARARRRVRKPKQLPPTDAVGRLLVHIAERLPDLALFVRMVAATGTRRSAVCALRWSDVDLDARELTIERAIVHGLGGIVEKGTKTGEKTTVLLDDGTIEDLRSHRARCAERALAAGVPFAADGFLFCHRERGRLDFHRPWHPEVVTHRFAKLRAEAGLAGVEGLTIKNLRHYVISHLLDRNVPLAVVSRQVQHARESTTIDHYDQPVDARDARVPEVLGSLLPPPSRRRSS